MAAVESSKKLVAILSKSGDPFRLMAAVAETDEAVSRFGKVVTILSNRVGHARARLGKRRSSPPVDPGCLMDHPLAAAASSPAPSNGRLHFSSSAATASPSPATAAAASSAANVTPAVVDRSLFLETTLLDLNSRGAPAPAASMAAAAKNSSKLAPAPMVNSSSSANHIQFQQPMKSFQFEQTPISDKFHIEMPRGVGGGGGKEVISFSFDNSVCTSSAATSFFTSISSQLISMSDAATNSAAAAAAPTTKKPSSCARKATADDDAGGKCHCPKKKSVSISPPFLGHFCHDLDRVLASDFFAGNPGRRRGYYRCSSKKDCPARKHVERCRSDPAMLLVTYENEHNHAQPLDLSVVQQATANPQT
uniref:WRKY DNA binding domain containing protein, expressed n=1 Tax=Oryza sativa subsp. japonica TaxID=39947 RepID=Q10C13_ORYSJ|nr:WRKY DNA binding domain containing protein, expressed [Oryza sativa Japonica Group]